MIAATTAAGGALGDRTLALSVRASAGLVWRSAPRMARKLRGFAATEAGSALDMWKAAELCDDPALRRAFFLHALDEARHARMFAASARRLELAAGGAATSGRYDAVHATRQNLYQRLGPVEFVVFVHLAERAGAAQFRALHRHFVRRRARHPHDGASRQLAHVFGRIAAEERGHVDYTARILEDLRRAGRGREVRRAFFRVRRRRVLEAWRRLGRVLGDRLTTALMALVYLVVLPLFALVARRAEPRRRGWHRAPRSPAPPLLAARRQF